MEKIIQNAKHGRASLSVPGDKSISHRALMLGAAAKGISRIQGLSLSEDVLATKRCFEKLGVTMESQGTQVVIHGKGGPLSWDQEVHLDCGNSGTTMRLMMGMLAPSHVSAHLTGDASLSQRPMQRVAGPLEKMGARITLTKGHAPVHVLGSPLQGQTLQLDVASAQIKSALLWAGLWAKGESVLTGAIHTRDHTERLLEHAGVFLEKDAHAIKLQGGQRVRAFELTVPGDMSSAAFWLGAAAVIPGASITLENIGLNPGRMGFVRVLERMGASITVKELQALPEPVGTLHMEYASLEGVHVSADEVPHLIDELPILAIAASQAHGVTKVQGAKELRVKESDRLEAIACGLRAMGVKLELYEDGFEIKGPQKLQGARIQTFHDHRIAMAFSIAGLVAQGSHVIEDASCVGVSYPGFFETLETL